MSHRRRVAALEPKDFRAARIGFSGRLHFARAEAKDAVVLHVDAGRVAVILRHAEVIVEANVERAGLERLGVIGATGPRAVTQVPLADGRRAVALGLEERGQIQPTRLDVQRSEGAQGFELERRPPTVAAGQQRIARGRADARCGAGVSKGAP